MARWVDPVKGKTETPIGPYCCGRLLGHRGVHALEGPGVAALWSVSGELLMSVQTTEVVGLAGKLDADEVGGLPPAEGLG